MRKSPVTLTALAAFAAAATIGIFVETGAAQEATQFRRAPAQLTPAVPGPLKPSRPQSLQAKPDRRPTGPGVIVLTPVPGGPKGGHQGPADIVDPSHQLANLVVEPYYNNPNNLPEGFPTHSYCLKNPAGGTPTHIRFRIRNVGNSASGGFQWTPMFPNAGAAPANVLPSIPANGQILITQGIPDGCYTPGFSGSCEFSIHLDDHDEVAESNEANTYESYCVSPAG